MTKTKLHHYFVTGRFVFPSDMLRYDAATVLLKGTVAGLHGYLIEGKHPATLGRWQSFSWSVAPAKRSTEFENWAVQIQGTWFPLTDESDVGLPFYETHAQELARLQRELAELQEASAERERQRDIDCPRWERGGT